jgi:adenosylmethionine-8-amino-7-oxononanoate aminotransferase
MQLRLGVVTSTAIPHPISTGAAAETLNVAAEEEREKQPVSTLAVIQETRQSLELKLRWLKRLKLPGTVVVVEAELERAGQATAEKDWRTNLTATWVKRMEIQVKKAPLKV